MASPAPSSLWQSWIRFILECRGATPDEQLLCADLMKQLAMEQLAGVAADAKQLQDICHPQLLHFRNLVVKALTERSEISELRNCQKFYAAISLMNSSLAPQDLWKALKIMQEACREAAVPQKARCLAGQLVRELLVIRCCHNTGNMDDDRFRLVMQNASGMQLLFDNGDNDLFSQ